MTHLSASNDSGDSPADEAAESTDHSECADASAGLTRECDSPSYSPPRPDELAEDARLKQAYERTANWKRWGPYLSERQWGTVREDYSQNQDAWNYFPHEHARSRAYRWGEDGLLGITDRQCRLCFAFALWNGQDEILKERLYGLTGPEGNHGEDVKECYYYLDSTPTHAFMRALYKYPQQPFPYQQLLDSNRARTLEETEFELLDSGVFDDNRYFDCEVAYAKASPNDILISLTVSNRGDQPADICILPQWWFRNTWTWDCTHEGCTPKPTMRLREGTIEADHVTLGKWRMACDHTQVAMASGDASPPSFEYLFGENETNPHRHPGVPTTGQYFKDAFHEYVVHDNHQAVNPKCSGTKAAGLYRLRLDPGESHTVRARMWADDEAPSDPFGPGFGEVFDQRAAEAEAFYDHKIATSLSPAERQVARQAYAGLLWTKQFYHYFVDAWIEGDGEFASGIPGRELGRNSDWRHVFNRDVISMPDKWEYPWYAAWDLAFHMLPMARIDLDLAKNQLLLFLREWYMHPNGSLPAYEWSFSDVNPPVHAWACWNVYRASGEPGQRDKRFLSRAFQKLLLNFTWWVNRKDPHGNHIFSGGFLGLDNIGVFDRSKPLPTGGMLYQADATAWMAFFCGNMLRIALELAEERDAYADMASKFFEHYLAIADATNSMHGLGLWDEEDGFYYDHIELHGEQIPLRVRSLVGLIPLCGPIILDERKLERLPEFRKRTDWFIKNRTDLAQHMNALTRHCPKGEEYGLRLLSLPNEKRLRRLLEVMLDENEFLSPHGIRSLSAYHAEHPFIFRCNGEISEVSYVPGESDSWMFGGNSNWRGPVWFPINYLIIESLRKYHEFYGQGFQIECPTGSGHVCTLDQVADEIERRLTTLFLPDDERKRPAHGDDTRYANDEYWRELVLFYEYFHGDTGRGLGASHQTGWTALVATMLQFQAHA
jgi:hypothetical protein